MTVFGNVAEVLNNFLSDLSLIIDIVFSYFDNGKDNQNDSDNFYKKRFCDWHIDQ